MNLKKNVFNGLLFISLFSFCNSMTLQQKVESKGQAVAALSGKVDAVLAKQVATGVALSAFDKDIHTPNDAMVESLIKSIDADLLSAGAAAPVGAVTIKGYDEATAGKIILAALAMKSMLATFNKLNAMDEAVIASKAKAVKTNIALLVATLTALP